MGWAVGDGRQINAWNDPWLSTSRLAKPMGPQPEHSSELKVADLLCSETQEWNMAKINQEFPFNAEAILSIKPSKLGAPDKLFWLHTKDGVYTTKTGYAAAVEFRDEQEEDKPLKHLNSNKGVWSLKTAPKVQLLLWKTLRGALPVGEALLHQHINIDPLCKRCGELESITHLLFKCDFADKVWEETPLVRRFDRRGLIDLEATWMGLIENPCLPPVGIVDGQLAPWIIWAIWTARNNLIFNNKICSPKDVITKAIVAAKEWLNAQNKEGSKAKIPRAQITVPSHSSIIQTDAAWNDATKNSGIGWIIKQTGETLSFQGSAKLVSSPLVAEALAMHEAVKKSKELGLQQVIFQSDSAQLIKALNSMVEPTELYGIVADIRISCLHFEFSTFCWIPREKNSEDDRLAKQALCIVSGGTTT
ncbi:uncharacterized protein LOC106417299 [Brassica napus]|uniref:uncharacterized protein LOC106417299 n=1 Tax=Brassica napus TaxID=3708 RepID=UPI0006AB5C8E|nr:uncharacterized protein LOC106417299 [Brassica napus]